MIQTSTTLHLLERLIAFPTVSSTSNLNLIAFARDYLGERGARVETFPNADGSKASLYAVLGDGPRGILLSGHTDVVPVTNQAWTSDPFALRRSGDRLYGRGTADMKGFVACALAAAEEHTTLQSPRPLHIALSFDEELGCLGVDDLLRHLKHITASPALCVVGEPSRMQALTGHKGKIAVRAICHGKAGHSSRPHEGINAIGMAAGIVALLRDHQQSLAASGAHDEAFEVPCSTISVGAIHGGEALNVIPWRCTLDFEIRNVPGDDATVVLNDIMRDALAVATAWSTPSGSAEVEFELLSQYPGLDTESERLMAFPAVARRLTSRKASYGTEAGLFASLGLFPVVVCGPGDIGQAHKADEYIEVDELERCNRMLLELLTRA